MVVLIILHSNHYFRLDSFYILLCPCLGFTPLLAFDKVCSGTKYVSVHPSSWWVFSLVKWEANLTQPLDWGGGGTHISLPETAGCFILSEAKTGSRHSSTTFMCPGQEQLAVGIRNGSRTLGEMWWCLLLNATSLFFFCSSFHNWCMVWLFMPVIEELFWSACTLGSINLCIFTQYNQSETSLISLIL